MLHSGLYTSYRSSIELQIVYSFFRINFIVRYMKVVYLTTKTTRIKQNPICSSHKLGLEVERPERSTIHSPFLAILHDKRNIFSFYAIFFRLHKEPAALFMKFPTMILPFVFLLLPIVFIESLF